MDAERGKKHQMGLAGAISYVVGAVIGAGIFISPVVVLQQTHSPGLTLVAWFVTGLIAILGSCVFAELATSIPRSGGAYAYAMYVGWNPIAFAGIYMMTFVAKTSSAAAASETFANYLIAAIDLAPEPQTKELLVKLIAHFVIWSLVFLNMLPLEKSASVIQITSTVCKLAGLAAVIVIGLLYIFRGDTAYLQQPFDNSNWDPVAIGLGIYGTLFSYAGWDILCAGMEEIKNVKRNGPIAIVGGMLIVMAVYVMTNVAYLAVLGPEQMLQSTAVAQSLGHKASPVMGVIIPFVVCISIIGSLNSSCFEHSRMTFSMAREKHLPNLLTLTHADFGSPIPSLFLMGILVSIMISMGKVETLIFIRVFIGNVWLLTIAAALVYIKIKKITVSDKAVKFPLAVPILYLLVMLPLSAVPFFQYAVMCGVTIAIVIFLVAIYFLVIRPERNSRYVSDLNAASTVFVQKLFLCARNETESIQHITKATVDKNYQIKSRTNCLEKSSDNMYCIKL